MNWNDKYGSEIELIFSDATVEASSFPAPLNEMALALIARCNPLQSNQGTNYISFLLPFWLQEHTASSKVLCRDLAVGNVFAMLHFFLLDDVMDAGAGLTKAEVRDTLVLGQLFLGLFQKKYSRHFSAESPLWTYYRRYMEDWALAVSQEGKHPADPLDPGQLARKSAPVKLCAAGMLLMSGREEQLTPLEEVIDLVLATLQLSDDWADWCDDLAEEANCNAFLTLVRQRLLLPLDRLMDEEKVRQAIYRGGCLDRLADIAVDYGLRLKRIPNAPAILIRFQQTLTEGIREDALAAEEMTTRLAIEGGISHLFMK